MAEIRPIKFSNELQSELFPENEFYKNSIAETGIGINVEKVQIPQAGASGSVGVGEPSSLPLTITKRTDDIKEYNVSQLYLEEPKLITNENEIVINYNKRADIQTSMALDLNTKAGDIAATEWGATLAANIVRTTGTTNRATEIVGATGNRKRLIYDDLVNMKGVMNRSNTPAGRWFGLLTAAMVDDIFLIDKLTDADKVQLAKVQDGEIGVIFGVRWMMRHNDTLGHSGIIYDNTATPVKKAVGAAVAATDNAAAIIWHERLVRHAEGNAFTYILRDHPAYLGTILNSSVRFGATFNRSDQKGIVTIVEANA